jgi:hypothetical protein
VKNRIVFCVVLILLCALGFVCYTYFAIVDTTVWERPSRAARENRYLALERWLAAQGRPVRVLFRGSLDTLFESSESTVFVEGSVFEWRGSDSEDGDPEAEDDDGDDSGPETEKPQGTIPRLTAWVRAGGRLVISIDTYEADWRLAKYLSSLGVREYDIVREYDEDEDDEESTTPAETSSAENSPEDTGQADGASGVETEKTAEDPRLIVDADLLPRLDSKEFKITGLGGGVDAVRVINGSKYVYPDKARILPEAIVFVSLEMGKGSITVTGDVPFLYNANLRKKSNAELAGALFLNDPGGVLLIRNAENEKHLFGSLADRGNPFALLVSAIVLAAAGFWMVIPLFGRFRPVPARPGKPLRERFLAEGRFLLKYGALDKYLSVYEAELEQRRRIRGTGTVTPGKTAMAAMSMNEDAAAKQAAVTTGKKLSLRDFIKSQTDYIAGLEELEQHWKTGQE